jgi:hypothetical protein
MSSLEGGRLLLEPERTFRGLEEICAVFDKFSALFRHENLELNLIQQKLDSDSVKCLDPDLNPDSVNMVPKYRYPCCTNVHLLGACVNAHRIVDFENEHI